CAASGVSATIDVTSVPLSAAAAALIAGKVVGVETLLAGGDDYEVLCTVPPAQGDALIALGRAAGLAVTAIGAIVAGHERPRFLARGGLFQIKAPHRTTENKRRRGYVHQGSEAKNHMTALWLIVLCGVLSVVYAIWATSSVLSADAGSPRMQEIAAAVREGAQAYLRRQYTTIGLVGIVIFALLVYFLGLYVAIGFAIGAILSGAAGFIGMNVSVRANVRTAQAATTSLAGGLELAFK